MYVFMLTPFRKFNTTYRYHWHFQKTFDELWVQVTSGAFPQGLMCLYFSEDAVEHDELDIFLRLKEKWNPDIDEDRPAPVAKPVGVPGASSPLQMTPDRLKSKIMAQAPASPLKGKVLPVNKRVGEFDVGDELSGYGLQGVKVTEDELRYLVAELGLDGDDAGDLVKGLTDATTPPKQAAAAAAPSESVDETLRKESLDPNSAKAAAEKA